MKNLTDRGLLILFIPIAVLLLMNGWFSYQNTQLMRIGSLTTSRNQDVIVMLDKIMARTIEAESGERAFFMTGDDAFLEPYKAMRATLDAEIAFLDKATSDDPAQRGRAAELKRRIDILLARMDKRIKERASTGPATPADVQAIGRSKEDVESVRAQVDEMVRAESASRDASIRRSTQNYNVALISGMTADALAFLFVGAFFWLLRSHLRERVKAENEVQAQRELLRTTISSIGDAVLTADRDGRITSLNPVAEALTGWSEREAVGRPVETVFVIFNEQTGEPVRNPVDRVLREGTIVGLANHSIVRARDGMERPIDDSAAPIRGGNGELAGVVMVFRDVTERRKSEQALQSEARTLATLNHIGRTVAAELDLERVVQTVTDAATELSGASFGAFFYNSVNERGESYLLYTLSGAPRAAFEKFGVPRNTAVFAPTFRGEGIVRSDDITRDPRYGKNAPHHGMPEGHLPVRSYLAAPVVSRSGEVIGGLFFGHPEPGRFTARSEQIVAGIASQAAIAIDNARLYQAAHKEIAERARAEEALRQSEENYRQQALELERQLIASGRLVSLGEITASMAHEFNNPLGIILGFAQDVRGAGGLREADSRALKIIEEEAERCKKIIEDMLQFARPAGAQPELGDLRRTVERSIELVANRLYKQKIEPATRFSPIPELRFDPVQIEQVLVNLYLNAVDAMPDGGKLSIAVQPAAERDARHVVIEVGDSGGGIEPADLPKIFQPFFTARKRTGLGLGLSVCERIVKNHGGRIEVESELGRGTTFKIYLPETTPA